MYPPIPYTQGGISLYRLNREKQMDEEKKQGYSGLLEEGNISEYSCGV
jgi:hypothetical protein